MKKIQITVAQLLNLKFIYAYCFDVDFTRMSYETKRLTGQKTIMNYYNNIITGNVVLRFKELPELNIKWETMDTMGAKDGDRFFPIKAVDFRWEDQGVLVIEDNIEFPDEEVLYFVNFLLRQAKEAGHFDEYLNHDRPKNENGNWALLT